jgi:hypothetical protein
MGNLSEDYVDPSITTTDAAAAKLIKQDSKNGWVVDFGKKVTMGKPSAVVKGYVPLQASDDAVFDMYTDIMNAVMTGCASYQIAVH